MTKTEVITKPIIVSARLFAADEWIINTLYKHEESFPKTIKNIVVECLQGYPTVKTRISGNPLIGAPLRFRVKHGHRITTIRFTGESAVELEMFAKDNGLSLGQAVRIIVAEYLDRVYWTDEMIKRYEDTHQITRRRSTKCHAEGTIDKS